MTKQITNIAQFKPLPKSRGRINVYICEAPNTTEAYAGEYSVRITFNGCAINAKTTLAINSCDNLYIKAFNPLTNVETNKLIRKPNVAAKNEYEDLILQVETLDGKIIKTMDYAWTPPAGVTLVPNPNEPYKRQINKLGRYTAQASSANGTSCPLSIDIFAEPCTIVGDAFNCNSTGGSTIDVGQTDLANLAVGDEFTTSDYTIVVTEASKTGTTFSGKGKLIFNFLKLSNTLALQIPISVTFTGIKINQCYQLYNGSVITEYDPSWGSVVSADQIKNQLSGVYTQIKDLMDNVSENAALLQQKIKDLRAARADLVNAEFTAEYKAEQLAALDAAISGMVCLVGEPPISGGRLSLFFNTNSCDVASVKLAINNASNIIENPTTNSEIDSDGLNVKYVNAINKGETVYTCNCGWFDTNHAFKVSGGADQRIGLDNLWKNIQRDFGQKSLMPGSNGYKLTYRQEAKSIGITKSYYIPYGLTLNVKKQIALAILRDVSVTFEALQIGGILLGDGSSSFEVSDLVSNQVGLYARFNNQDKDTILQNCGKLTPAESLAIYKLYPTIWDQFNFTYRNTTFNPIFFSNTYCTNPVFPYNNIEPLNPSGSFSNTFRYWNDFD